MKVIMTRPQSLQWILLACMLAILACDHDKDTALGQTPAAPAASAPSDSTRPALNLVPDSGPPPAFDGDRAMQYVKDIVKFGPRPVGSANHKKVEEYIASRLKGDQVEDDSLYGITHVAEKWQGDGTLKKIRAFLLADMVGDADLNIDRDLNSTPWLENVVGEAAKRLGYQSHFFARTNEVGDDHIPFMKRGVPSADLIDFTYGYNDVFWHTTQDTVDKLSPKSFQIVGSVMLETIRILDKMDPLPPK